MKILRVITRLNVGGPSHQAQSLHEEFSRRGHECTLIHGSLDFGEANSQRLHGEAILHAPELVRPISPLKDWQFLKRLTRLLSEEPYEILHTHTAKAGLLSRVAALRAKKYRKKNGLPNLQVNHTFHGHVFHGYFGPPLSKLVLTLERWLSKHTDHLITLSPQLQSEISSYLNLPPNEIKIIPLGLNLHAFLDQPQERMELNQHSGLMKKSWVGWVGRMVPIKNPHGFLDFAEAILKNEPNTGFAMIGDGPLTDSLKEEIRHRKLEGDFFLAGWVKDISPWMPAFDLLINTSHNEGTPVAILEAMAAGTPVLCSEVGGCRDILPQNEPCSTFTTQQPFAHLHTVLDWIKNKVRISQKTRIDIIETYSVKRLSDDLEKIYQGVP